MTNNVWFTSDSHWGHANFLNFKDSEGKLIRPFNDVKEMDEYMVDKWNSVVKPSDRVYHLGDVSMNKKGLENVKRCNGRKVLLKGNHDIFKINDYLEVFEDIRMCKVYPEHGIIFCHFPVHPQQLEFKFKINAHGHIHEKIIQDPRYINLCVEHWDYTPVSLEQVVEKSK